MSGTQDDGSPLIRRRYVLYVEGYDPQGAEGYHRLFADSLRRFLENWRLKASAGELVIDSDDFAHWTVEAAGPNWRVETRYEFLRQEQMIRANMAEPMWRQVPRALHWAVNYLVTGTLYRVYRASHQYGLALSYFQMLMLLWLGASALGGWLIGALLLRLIGGPVAFGWIAGMAATLACFRLLRPLADKLFVVQINNHWPYLLEYGRGEPTCFDRCIEAGARRVVEIARANQVDEIVVVGHSGGGVTAPAVLARALELDAELGRHGPRVVLLTPGSLMPGIGLHRGAVRVHRDIARIAVEPSVQWVNVTARADVLNFHGFDPVAGIGIDAGPARCNPMNWQVRLRDMIAPEHYDANRWNLFRMHYQFIMGNDMRAPYEYMMLVCGPVAVEQWARRDRAMLACFGEDGSYRPA
jgi:pimeloyl-ACP methyl ester carboxylesterase